jgi:nitroreductase
MGTPMAKGEVMEVWEAIARRASIRHYRADDVPPKVIQRILEAAISAPSAGNAQPWHFWVVHNAAVKSALSEAAWNQQGLLEAPVVIVVCAVPDASAATYGSRGRDLYCLQDTAAAVTTILLMATALELGTCWVGAFDESRVAAALDLPTGQRPVAMVTLGYPAEPTKSRTNRRSLSAVSSRID